MKKKFQNPVEQFSSGYKLEDYVIGKQIGKGCNAAVYEAAAPFVPLVTNSTCSLLQRNGKEKGVGEPKPFISSHSYPLAVKMMWNIGVCSSSTLTYYYTLVHQ